jgi:hypothetical protein
LLPELFIYEPFVHVGCGAAWTVGAGAGATTGLVGVATVRAGSTGLDARKLTVTPAIA